MREYPCILDNDLYKFTMMQAVFHQFPDTQVEYEFVNRGGEDLWSVAHDIGEQIGKLQGVCFMEEELEYLRQLPFIKDDFVDFLRNFQLDPDRYVVYNKFKDVLNIRIKGPWLHTILFEVPLLSIISEVWSAYGGGHPNEWNDAVREGKTRLFRKALRDWNFKLADFGTRRRFSWGMQKHVVETLKDTHHFVGTSNVELAMLYNVTPIGTMAHEWIMAGQAFVHPRDSQKFMLQKWADEYRGNLGYALTDTISVDAFTADLDKYFAMLYDGFRQDSGDPIEFVDKIVAELKYLKISPYDKQFIFSDSLDFKQAQKINDYCKGKMLHCSFGIGTFLTHDVGRTPLNMVIKLTEVNGRPVAKISDSPGKTICKDKEYVKYLKKAFTNCQEYDIVEK